LLPLADHNPRRTTPVVNIILVVVNVLIFFWEVSLGPQLEPALFHVAFVPARFWNLPGALLPNVITMFVSMFLHGGWLHLGGNMLYLWIFGDNVEDRVGHGRFLVFYLLCGVAAALAQTFAAPASLVPMVGASGAIAGVMGAYFVLYPKSRIVTLVTLVFFFQVVEVPAIAFLGIWFVMQFLSGVGSIVSTASGDPGGGVAFWAHVAGFAAGAGGIFVFRRPERERVEWWHDV
jgi:membrane associated rhomboid family serine protease